MPSATRIVEAGRVVVPGTARGGSSSSLVKLSALDAPWLLAPLIQRVLLFVDGIHGQELPPFASMVTSLRGSLAATLARFPPLAGRVVFLPDTGDAAIDCSSKEALARGVRFVVAESEGADAARLAGDADHDVAAFRELVPELETGKLPAEALAVQVTRLDGGVAVGVAMHHAVVDGRSVWRFIQAWAAACRGDDSADAKARAPVVFDRAALGIPDGEELARSTLRKYAPDLPVVAELPVAANLPRRTFTITTDRMSTLKQRITDAGLTSSSAQTAAPSSFVAVTALAWASFLRSKHSAAAAISLDQDVYLFFLVDCRGRGRRASEDYFGTCITGCLAKATAKDLLAADGVAFAAAVVREEVRRAAEDPLALWDWMGLAWSPVPKERLVNVSGSTRFPAYQASDFGWGAPRRTELVTMNHGGQVVLVAGKGGDGGVQASVCLEPEYMDAFTSHFLSF